MWPFLPSRLSIIVVVFTQFDKWIFSNKFLKFSVVILQHAASRSLREQKQKELWKMTLILD